MAGRLSSFGRVGPLGGYPDDAYLSPHSDLHLCQLARKRAFASWDRHPERPRGTVGRNVQIEGAVPHGFCCNVALAVLWQPDYGCIVLCFARDWQDTWTRDRLVADVPAFGRWSRSRIHF